MKCETMAKQLPGLRALIAKELSVEGLTQEEISRILGVSQGAVSQYIGKHRGSRISPDIEPFVKELCHKVVKEKANLEKEICNLCRKSEDI